MDRIEALYSQMESLDPFSEERDAFATAILGGSVQLPMDGEGRINLPEALLADAQIEGSAIFVGKGKTFEIWAPDAYRGHADAARALAKRQRLQLKSSSKQEA